MCKTKACTDITATTAVPNVLGCNLKADGKAEDFVLAQNDVAGANTVYT
jgi:hypothetical protein